MAKITSMTKNIFETSTDKSQNHVENVHNEIKQINKLGKNIILNYKNKLHENTYLMKKDVSSQPITETTIKK